MFSESDVSIDALVQVRNWFVKLSVSNSQHHDSTSCSSWLRQRGLKSACELKDSDRAMCVWSDTAIDDLSSRFAQVAHHPWNQPLWSVRNPLYAPLWGYPPACQICDVGGYFCQILRSRSNARQSRHHDHLREFATIKPGELLRAKLSSRIANTAIERPRGDIFRAIGGIADFEMIRSRVERYWTVMGYSGVLIACLSVLWQKGVNLVSFRTETWADRWRFRPNFYF